MAADKIREERAWRRTLPALCPQAKHNREKEQEISLMGPQ